MSRIPSGGSTISSETHSLIFARVWRDTVFDQRQHIFPSKGNGLGDNQFCWRQDEHENTPLTIPKSPKPKTTEVVGRLVSKWINPEHEHAQTMQIADATRINASFCKIVLCLPSNIYQSIVVGYRWRSAKVARTTKAKTTKAKAEELDAFGKAVLPLTLQVSKCKTKIWILSSQLPNLCRKPCVYFF